jgi:segregation and condensation protein B
MWPHAPAVRRPAQPAAGRALHLHHTKQFLSHFRFDTLRNLPNMEQFEEAGLLSKRKLLAGALPGTSARPRI